MQTFIYLVYLFCDMEQKIAELESKMKTHTCRYTDEEYNYGCFGAAVHEAPPT